MSTNVKIGAAALVVVAFLGFLAYDSSQQVPEENIFSSDREYDRVVVVGIDLSGSFVHLMADEAKAWGFLMQVIDRYLRGNGNEKLILVQLSGNNRALIWDGSPTQLRKDFPDQEAFRKHLLAKADPGGSRLHDGITEALEYAKTLPGTSAKTKRAVLILSDMEDNVSTAGSEQRLSGAFRDFAQQGGVAGLYFVEHSYVPRWRANCQSAGLRHWVVESQIVATPTLPTFD